MTAEVAILNQYAVVLAADSATTVTNWVGGKRERRYFKGANKLFQLSGEHPVGLMIFGSASLHGVPWEIIVKDFRRYLGNASRDTLADYAESFFGFVKSHSGLFPSEARERNFVSKSVNAAMETIFFKLKDEPAVDSDAKVAAIREQLAGGLADLRCQEAPEPLTPEMVAESLDKHLRAVSDRLTERIQDELKETPPLLNLAMRELATLAEMGVLVELKRFRERSSTTGVVIAGYGNTEFFPALEAFTCYGFVDNHLATDRRDVPGKIDERVTSIIEPFATTSMINTLRLGMSPDVFELIHTGARKCLRTFGQKLAARLGVEESPEDLDAMVEEAYQEYQDEVFVHNLANHYTPLTSVISSLPVGDMAALAKSLIELQSLKERVTAPSESVAGPIDVAVISKHDGFVWVERKHYFNSDLNPRFINRLKSS